MIGNASGANKETGELGGRVAFSRSEWVVYGAHTQDVMLSGDDTNDRREPILDFAVLFVGCARFQMQCWFFNVVNLRRSTPQQTRSTYCPISELSMPSAL